MKKQMSSNSLQNPQVARKTKIILDTIERAYEQLKKDEKKEPCSFIERISLNLEQNKVESMLMNLIKGYIIKKHSSATNEPHEKFLYVSEDQRFLCWKSLDKSDEKMIELRKIESIFIAQEALRHIKSQTRKNIKRTFVIKCDYRTLEIECSQDGEAECIAEELEEAIKNSRRLHLSYRF